MTPFRPDQSWPVELNATAKKPVDWNPYQPPAVHLADGRLIDDETSICVPIPDTGRARRIVLPQVCLFTGEYFDLVLREGIAKPLDSIIARMFRGTLFVTEIFAGAIAGFILLSCSGIGGWLFNLLDGPQIPRVFAPLAI